MVGLESQGRTSSSASISWRFNVSIRCRNTARLVVSANGSCSFASQRSKSAC
jgi:hypothetical protein